MFQSKDEKQVMEEKHLELMELMLKHETLNRDTEALFHELQVTPEQLTAFIENKSNFSDDNWNRLQEEKNKLEQRIQTEIANIRNQVKVKKAYEERQIANHWIFVR